MSDQPSKISILYSCSINETVKFFKLKREILRKDAILLRYFTAVLSMTDGSGTGQVVYSNTKGTFYPKFPFSRYPSAMLGF